jgi:AraC family transcriptional regulator
VIQHGQLLLEWGLAACRRDGRLAWGKLLSWPAFWVYFGAMSASAAVAPKLRILAQGTGWRASDVVCRLGPADRPFEERHERVSIAAVLAGTFQYRSANGNGLLYPGAVMLGNPGTCYQCGHEHGVGDHCLALQYEPDYFAEIAHGAGTRRFRFRAGMLPALRPLAAPLARLQGRAARADALALEESVVEVAEAVVCAAAGTTVAIAEPGARDQRRISRALRHLEANVTRRLSLDELAATACMSKYHFLRCFRRIVGMTPHVFLVDLRLRRAAAALRASKLPVARVAFDAGFGDLSEFHGQFRAAFGASPGRFRAA